MVESFFLGDKNCLSKGMSVVETNNDGFIWIKLCRNSFWFDDDLYASVVYIPQSNSLYYMSHALRFYEMLEGNVRKYEGYGNDSVIGDLKARCGRFAKYGRFWKIYSFIRWVL